MSVFTSRPALRWLVPGAVLVAAVGATTVGQVLTADAAPALPPRTAAQLLVDLQTADVAGLSGTVVQKADLGLPELPANVGGGRNGTGFNALVAGSHTLRVWYGGPTKQRVALLGTLGESDIIRNGADVWTWNSDQNAASHTRLPADRADKPQATPTPATPQEAADQALAAIDPTTKVTTDGTASVAGRSAYELVLAPRDGDSLIGQVRLAVDADTHIPLRVRVYAKGASSPAVEVGFSQISFTQPADQQFRFSPPPGVKVTESQAPAAKDKKPTTERPAVIGKGWTSVLTASGVKMPADNQILNSFPRVTGAWGSGRLVTSSLASVLITDDGRLFVGAVKPELLYRAAAK